VTAESCKGASEGLQRVNRDSRGPLRARAKSLLLVESSRFAVGGPREVHHLWARLSGWL